MTPAASNDPLVGPVLTGASVDVQCEARQRSGAAPVDPNKVNIAIYGATGTEPVARVAAVVRSTDVYGASLPLGAVPTGRVRIRCVASDSASNMPQENFAEIQTFYDGGPIITFTNLNESSVVARGTDREIDLPLQFKVEPARLGEGDLGAEVGEVKLTISEREVALAAPDGVNYKQELDFLDFFAGVPVESVSIEVTASNQRSPAKATTKRMLTVRVDGEGPAITFNSPRSSGNGPPIVNGTVTVELKITDNLAGVAQGEDKLYAHILHNGERKQYPLLQAGPDTYRFTFEASSFPDTTDITVIVHAVDHADNEREGSQVMALDTVPPWVSLAPPRVRETTGSPLKCSAPFDPLGSSPDDGEVISQASLFRMLVWERGIEVEGAEQIWLSGIRNDTVKLYAQDDPSVPLIIDQDKDGICDSINSGQALGERAPDVKSFSPVNVGGNYPIDINSASDDPQVGTGPCSGLLETGNTDPRCGSELVHVIGHTHEGRAPVIYAQEPRSSGVGCTGISFDLNLRPGWICLAAAARDGSGTQGNLGISQPIRVCRQLSDSDCDGKPKGEILTPPSTLTCTDGCTLPLLWTEQGMPRILVH